MRIYLDGNLLDQGATSLAEAIDIAADAAGERLICDGETDGLPISSEDFDSPPQSPTNAQEVRFISATREDLVRAVLGQATDLLDAVKSAQSHAARSLQAGKTTDAMSSLADVVSGWSQVGQALRLAMESGVVQAADGAEASVTDATSSLEIRLSEIRDALASHDLTVVADVLAYDMEEAVDRWDLLLRDFAQCVRR